MRPPWIRTLYRIESKQTLSAAWVDDRGEIMETWSERQSTRLWLRRTPWKEVQQDIRAEGGTIVNMGRRTVVGKVNKE